MPTQALTLAPVEHGFDLVEVTIAIAWVYGITPRSAGPAPVAEPKSARRRVVDKGSSTGGSDEGDEIGPLNLVDHDGHRDAPGDPEQQAEGDVAEPVHAEHEAGIDHE